MQIYFKSRTALRSFKGNGKKVDNGTSVAASKRWALEIVRRAA